MLRGRFAPSPTGRLHLGNLRSALLGWLDVRSRGGEFWVRIEDLDPDRSKPEAIDGILFDLEWLGLDWDGPVWRQSERGAVYAAALATLEASGRVYPCWCSRAEIARAASAPHAGEDGPVYPGTCRHGAPARPGRTPSLRFQVEPGVERFIDRLLGPTEQNVAEVVGDFVVRRVDGVASYQLAVVVDDALSGITDVSRADDLLLSTPRQLQLIRALGYPTPTYTHWPLLLGDDGKRLAKRDGGLSLDALRAQGLSAEQVVGLLAQSCGLRDGAPIRARELAGEFSLGRVTRGPTSLPPIKA